MLNDFLNFKKIVITISLIFIGLMGYSQEFSTIKSVENKNNSFVIKISNQKLYQLLIGWTDQTITQKYTSVPGIISFNLNRNVINEIKTEISKENLVFLLSNYIILSENDIVLVQNKK